MERRFPVGLAGIVFLASGLFGSGTYGQSLGLRPEHDGRHYHVAVTLDGQEALTSPAEGLWSMATGGS